MNVEIKYVRARLISVDELRKYLSICRTKAYQLCKQPDFASCVVMIGQKILIDVDEVDKWIDEHRKCSDDIR